MTKVNQFLLVLAVVALPLLVGSLPSAPKVRNLIVYPDPLTVKPGAKQQMCAFLRFRNTLHVGLRRAERSTPFCVHAYQSRYSASERRLTWAERAVADRFR